eukprot:COSAG02_NODE_13421_length_1397_cov_1.171032_1_plen_51_part_10
MKETERLEASGAAADFVYSLEILFTRAASQHRSSSVQTTDGLAGTRAELNE